MVTDGVGRGSVDADGLCIGCSSSASGFRGVVSMPLLGSPGIKLGAGYDKWRAADGRERDII